MTKRKFRKALKRLRYLPKGLDLGKYLFNKVKSIYYSKSKNTKVAYPSTIMLEVTNYCNLKCMTCAREYRYGKEMDKGYMDLDSFKKVINEAYPYIDSVGLTGLGETFLYKEIIEAVEYIRSKSKGIIISASINAHVPNCISITEQLVNKIDTIQISVDGLFDVYERVRANGNFNTFLTNTRKIIQICNGSLTDIILNAVIFEENYTQMAELIKFSKDEKIKFLNFTPINLAGIPNNDKFDKEFYKSGEFQKIFEDAKRLVKIYTEMEISLPNFKNLNIWIKCPYPWGHFYITWDGYLVPCCAKPFPKELNFGNVFEEGLLTTLNSESFRSFREEWLNYEMPKFCKNCS